MTTPTIAALHAEVTNLQRDRATLTRDVALLTAEREADYLPLITQRIHRRRDPIEAVRQNGGDLGLFDLDDEEETA